MILTADRVFTPTGWLPCGQVEIEGDRIVGVRTGEAGSSSSGSLLVPGFVDTHSHGGGTAAFSTTDRADVETVLATHLKHGTTTMVASLVTESYESLTAQVTMLKECVKDGTLAGIHLEGPWLAVAYKGAHPEALLRDPLPQQVEALLDAAEGTVKMVTIAVEREGAMESVRLMAERGIMAAIGHTDASYEEAQAAIEAGARGATHLFNAMPSLHHRTPGPVLALLEDDRVYLELVCDGTHVRPELIAYVMETQPDRVVFVTDAMAAAGAADGDYILGTLPVRVVNGVARLVEGGSIAGSTLTLDQAIRVAVGAGVKLEAALTACTSRAAEYMNLSDVGSIEVGKKANFVLLDAETLTVQNVMKDGVWRF